MTSRCLQNKLPWAHREDRLPLIQLNSARLCCAWILEHGAAYGRILTPQDLVLALQVPLLLVQMPALLEFELSLARIGPQFERGEAARRHILIHDVGLTTDIGIKDSLVVLPRERTLFKFIVQCEILSYHFLLLGSTLITILGRAVVVFDEVSFVRYGHLRFDLTDKGVLNVAKVVDSQHSWITFSTAAL